MSRFITILARNSISSVQAVYHKLFSTVQVGSALPMIDLYENFPSNKINLSELTWRKKVVLLGVTGAFFPNCSAYHLPGYVERADQLKKEGFDDILCISVNDPYVMTAWGIEHRTEGKIRMLSDPNGDFIKATGLGIDLPVGGYRSKRFSMVVVDNCVEELNIEPDGVGITCTLAEQLKYKVPKSTITPTDDTLM